MFHREIVVEFGSVVKPAIHGYDVDVEKSNQRFAEVLRERLKARHPLLFFTVQSSEHRNGYAVNRTGLFVDVNGQLGRDPDVSPIVDQLLFEPVAWLVRK